MFKSIVSLFCFTAALSPWTVVIAMQQQTQPAKASISKPAKQSNITPVKPTTKRNLSANEKKWLELEPVIAKYRQARVEASQSLAKRLVDTLVQLDSEIDGQGFAEEILGLQNIHQVFGSNSQISAFVHRSFEKHVVNVDDIEQALIQFLREHDAKMAEIDNQFLIECQLDVDFDPRAIHQSRVQLEGVRQELRRVSAGLDQTVSHAFTHHLIAGAAGLAGGEVGNAIGNELGRDANGNATMEGQVLGFLFGAATAWAAEEVASSAMGTEKQIADRATTAGRTIIRNQLLLNDGFKPAWLETVGQTTKIHDRVCFNTLMQVLGPHPGSQTQPSGK